MVSMAEKTKEHLKFLTMDLLKKGQAIYRGWKNYIRFDDLPEVLKMKARTRGQICASCPYIKHTWFATFFPNWKWAQKYAKFQCGKCGCPIHQKVLQDVEPCPDERWK